MRHLIELGWFVKQYTMGIDFPLFLWWQGGRKRHELNRFINSFDAIRGIVVELTLALGTLFDSISSWNRAEHYLVRIARFDYFWCLNVFFNCQARTKQSFPSFWIISQRVNTIFNRILPQWLVTRTSLCIMYRRAQSCIQSCIWEGMHFPIFAHLPAERDLWIQTFRLGLFRE